MGRIPHLELFHSPFRNIEPRRVVSAMLRWRGGEPFLICSVLREAACFNGAIPVCRFGRMWRGLKTGFLTDSNKVRADLHKHFHR